MLIYGVPLGHGGEDRPPEGGPLRPSPAFRPGGKVQHHEVEFGPAQALSHRGTVASASASNPCPRKYSPSSVRMSASSSTNRIREGTFIHPF